MEYVVFCLLGYLFGSVTFGYLIPRLIKGVDVRALSSDGNPGTANAFLYGGVFCGILVLLADLEKGALPVFLAGGYLFFSLVLVVELHSLRTGFTFLIWSVLGVHFTPLSSIKYGIVLIAFVVIRKHLSEIRRIPKGQACFALRKG